MRLLFALLALGAPAAASAGDGVSLTSSVFVERVREDAEGRRTVVLEPPAVVTPGDRVVFVLSYRNSGTQPATGFAVTNPIPASIDFESVVSNGAEVSVDGGANWGQLGSLRVAQPDGVERPAQPADVTHVRWVFNQPIPAGGNGELRFRGIVE